MVGLINLKHTKIEKSLFYQYWFEQCDKKTIKIRYSNKLFIYRNLSQKST